MVLKTIIKNACLALSFISAGALIGAAYAGRSTGAPMIAHGKLTDFTWVDLPEFGGEEAIIYRSPDGKRVAAAFRESGKATFTYPFDEFFVVTSGSVQIAVHGGDSFGLTSGEVAYIPEGTTVDLQFSDDFSNVTCLMSDREVKWR